MSVSETEEPAEQPAGAGTAALGTRPAGGWLSLAAWALGTLSVLGALLLLAGELAAARVPEHRAALEELIRRQTGLEVTFNELSVRWGWYGPEAVFHAVELGEPGGRGARLRAPQLIVGLDVWRWLRSAELEASRITLVGADIDLTAGGGPVATAAAGSPAQMPLAAAGARLLSHWRGGRIDLEGGTLRWPASGEPLPLMIGVRRAQLRRADGAWSADAWVLLPARLGTTARFALQMKDDPTRAPAPSGAGLSGAGLSGTTLSGTLSFEGRGLEFSGWQALGELREFARYLPQAGRGNLEVRGEVAHGTLARADGRLQAQALEWRTRLDGVPLRIEHVRASWALARAGALWHLSGQALELEPNAAPLTLDATLEPEGSAWHAELQGAPVALLAGVVRAAVPQLPLAQLSLGGLARELSVDWDGRRAPGQRLTTRARLEDLSIASAANDAALTGLTAQLSGNDRELLADLTASAAELTVTHAQPARLDRLTLAARLTVDTRDAGWEVASDDLQIRREDMSVTASGVIGAQLTDATPRIRAHVVLRDADVALLAALAGPEVLASLGGAATQLTAGHISDADLVWRGPLASGQPPWARGSEFHGTLELRGAALSGSDPWPGAHDLNARLEWHGAHFRAAFDGGRFGTFQLQQARAQWDAQAAQPTHVTARLKGSAQQALVWLREHPQLAAYAPGAADVDLRGDTLLDVDLLVPLAAAGGADAVRVRSRITAQLDGVELRAVAGLPPLAALSGTLVFSGGHLLPSSLTGQWLGGPVALNVGERRDSGLAALAISGHGSVDAHQALLAAGAADDVQLEGSAEWTALLSFLPGTPTAGPRWRLRADSNLIGVTSELPEPFAKSEGALLPLHVEVQAEADEGQLRVSLGERLRALAQLNRSGELWRIARGTVRLAATAPVLPAQPLLQLEGRVGRLDLPAYLALWRAAGQDAALPALRAHLTTAQLVAGTRSFAEASVTAAADRAGGQLEVDSADLAGSARWRAPLGAANPLVLHLTRLEVPELSDVALGAQLAGALSPAVQLSIDEVRWQGRSLGAFSGTFAAGAAGLDVDAFHLSSADADTRGSARCLESLCRLEFTLASGNAGATLAAFGFRPEVGASPGSLEGRLDWPRGTPFSLASLNGRLHMQLEQGSMHAAGADAAGMPFALLAVPALASGLTAEKPEVTPPEVAFARVSADYTVGDGQVQIRDLHFDGDTEILVRGRAGLVAHDYDAQAWILRGEERLPAALRRFGPTPRVAAVWLSLRELFGAERARTALHLHGRWDEPMVSGAE